MACVLIIDDEELIRRTLRYALEGAGHMVTTAGDGREGLKEVRAAAFDVIVTDIIMPHKEGIETILEIRKHYPSVPIIATSGGGQIGRDRLLSMAEALGATASLAKPFRPRDLLTLIDRCLAAASPRRE